MDPRGQGMLPGPRHRPAAGTLPFVSPGDSASVATWFINPTDGFVLAPAARSVAKLDLIRTVDDGRSWQLVRSFGG